MHLRKRRARDGKRVDEREERVDVPAEFLAQPGRDFIERPRGNAVLQLLQLCTKFRRQEVCENADELADLDEQAAQLEDGTREPARAAFVLLDQLRVIETRAEQRLPETKPGVADENANGDDVRFRRTKAQRTAGPPSLELFGIARRDYLHCGYDGSGPAIAGRSLRTATAHMMS